MSTGPHIPSPEGLNAEFYAHAAGGTLHLQRCVDCGRFRHPPRYVCAACFSGRVAWVPAAGTATLYSWTITHRAFDRGWADQIPYMTGVAELDEGVRLIGALRGLEREQLRLGLPLAIRLDAGEQFTFISLHPAGGDDH